MKKRYLYIPFIRQDGLDIDTLAIVKVEAKDSLTSDDCVEVLKKVVTKWAKETEDGKDCWEQSGHDLNIGDLSLYESDFSKWAKPSLKKAGITDFEIPMNVSVHSTRPFDELLVDAGDIESEE